MNKDSLNVHAAVSHSDWGNMSWRGKHGIQTFGRAESIPDRQPRSAWPWYVRDDDYMTPDGVDALVRTLARSGITRVYWRVFGGGKALYPSRYADSFGGAPDLKNQSKDALHFAFLEKIDYSTWDCLREAVKAAHAHGVELHAWYTFREEDHTVGFLSRFAREHPEFCQVNKHGRRMYSNLSWAFPQVVEYKRNIVREILGRGVDGLLLDYCRKNNFKYEPVSDLNACFPGGYEGPVVESFTRETGRDPRALADDDPEWQARRARVETDFLKQARTWTAGKKLGAMVYESHNYDYHLLDTAAWDQAGLLDYIVPVFQDRPFNLIHQEGNLRPCPQYSREHGILDDLRLFVKEMRTPVIPGVYCYDFVYPLAGRPDLQNEVVGKRLAETRSAGTPAVAFFESNHLALAGRLQPGEQ